MKRYEKKTAIINGTLVIVSYGSYMGALDPSKATESWIVKLLVTNSRGFGVVRLGNTEKDTTPYQAELMGALDRIVATRMISKRSKVVSGSVKLSLNNMK